MPPRRPAPPSWSHPPSQSPRPTWLPGPSETSDSSAQASLASPCLPRDPGLRRRPEAHAHSNEGLSMSVSCRTGIAVTATGGA